MANLPLQNFIQNQTVINANWLNQVDQITHPITVDAAGHFTVAAPTAAGTALTLNTFAGAASPALVINVADTAGTTVQFTGSVNQAIAQQTINTSTGNQATATLSLGDASGNAAFMEFQCINSVAQETGGVAGLAGNLGTSSAIPFQICTNDTVRMTFSGAAQAITCAPATAPAAGGSLACGILFSSIVNLGLFFGVGAPTFAAAQGSIYSNVSGAAGARLYVNTNGGTTWVPATSL